MEAALQHEETAWRAWIQATCSRNVSTKLPGSREVLVKFVTEEVVQKLPAGQHCRFFVDVESIDSESRDEKSKSEDCPDCSAMKQPKSRTVKDFEEIAEKIASQRNQGFVWPVTGQIRSGFGNRRHPIKGVVKFHKGIDIAGNNGKTVSAAKAGKVTLSYSGCKNGNKSCNGGGGNWIEISHPDGTKTRYLHMSSKCRIPKKGTSLKQGDAIGCVGATGAVTGPHLHFRVMKNGRYMNPLSALPKRKG